jgi:Planctomycete cytochrome C
MKSKFFLSIFSLVFLFSCTHEPTVDINEPIGGGNNGGGGNGGGGGNSGCDPNTVYFVNDILPIIVSNCAMSGCHDPASHEDGVILNNYANIVSTGEIVAGNPWESELFEKITEDDNDDIMPPPPSNPLTGEQIALIQTWIQQGAQNNECTEFECDLTNVTFANTIQPIIADNCAGCHDDTNPSAGLSLLTYSQISAIAQNGSLENALYGTNGITLMPYNSNQLNDCYLEQINIWITEGTPNN